MLRAWLGDNPNSGVRIRHRRVGDQLPQVVVVGPFELILDDYSPPQFVLCNKIDTEGADRALALCRDEGQANLTSFRTSTFSSSHVVRSYASCGQTSRSGTRSILPLWAARRSA